MLHRNEEFRKKYGFGRKHRGHFYNPLDRGFYEPIIIVKKTSWCNIL